MSPLLRSVLALCTFLLVCAYALRRGGKPERWAASILLAGMVLTWALIRHSAQRYHAPEIGVAVADGLTLVALVWLMLRADRYWPGWLAAMQAIVVLSHLAMLLRVTDIPGYYKNTIQLWIYPQLAVLATGVLRHRLRTAPGPAERTIGRAAASLWRRARDGAIGTALRRLHHVRPGTD
ncbi:hypothetical protein HL653_01785 [Sphingomonas sp. AP4-R1]|uniref:hypothetical protein n=1 Tax=Sphingomonas sp. AP4-R1 TaxID=2735134 RepID=UPI0014934013|nr:hypothetical protein [Sphingomonas sp. AP4-R1]QJU56685.1 hypothetical protein HL653_01785 [Sphingomonas sp. AP4-R1]